MQRVMIVGGPGSGKTTLANALAERVALPLWHVDQILWEPNWVERDETQRMRALFQIQMHDRWIIDGCYPPTFAERLARADTLIFLDLPVLQRMLRVTTRIIEHRGQPRPEMPAGCIERFDRNYLEFLDFIWRTRDSRRDPILRILESPPPHLTVHHLRSGRQVRKFIKSLGQPVVRSVAYAVPSTG